MWRLKAGTGVHLSAQGQACRPHFPEDGRRSFPDESEAVVGADMRWKRGTPAVGDEAIPCTPPHPSLLVAAGAVVVRSSPGWERFAQPLRRSVYLRALDKRQDEKR